MEEFERRIVTIFLGVVIAGTLSSIVNRLNIPLLTHLFEVFSVVIVPIVILVLWVLVMKKDRRKGNGNG